MDRSQKEIINGILEAIQAENSGYYFYSMAAQNTSDPQGKKVLNILAEEEQQHQEFLKKQYRSLLEKGETDSEAKLSSRLVLQGESPIFSSELKNRVKNAGLEMSILSIAVQLEHNAMNYYKNMAEKAKDPKVKNFFLELSEWEAGHYQALLTQQEALKEDYWADSGFVPF